MVRKRELAKMSQSQLAKSVGVRPEQISRFESGTFPLKKEHLVKIKEILSNAVEHQKLE